MNFPHIIFSLFSRYFWALAIIAALITAFQFREALKIFEKQNADFKKDSNNIFWGYLILMSLPWIVMGIGIILGGVPSFWYFLQPREGNPYVIAWSISVFLVIVSVTYWIFFRKGAEMLIKYSILTNINTTNANAIKSLWVIFALIILAAGAWIWVGDFSIPTFDH